MKSLKYLVCAVIGVAIISLGFGSINVQAAGEDNSTVIEISTVQEFNKLNNEYASKQYAGYTFKLTANLTLPDDIRPINSFSGVFDGNGYEISVNYNNKHFTEAYIWGVYYFGLFRNMSGTIKNLSVVSTKDYNIGGKSNVGLSALYVGGIVGLCDNGTVINCHSNVNIYSTRTPFSLVYVGGVVGCMRGTSTVSGCFADGSIDYSNLVGTPYGVACVGFGEDASQMTLENNYYVEKHVPYAGTGDATGVAGIEEVVATNAFQSTINSNNNYWMYLNGILIPYDRITTEGVSAAEVADDASGESIEIVLPEIEHPEKKLVGWEVKCSGNGACKFYQAGENVAVDGDDIVTPVYANFKMSDSTYIRTTAVDGLKCEGKIEKADFDAYRTLVNTNCEAVNGTAIGIKLKMIVFYKDAIKTNLAGNEIVDGMALTKEDFAGKKFVEVECDDYISDADTSGFATVGVTIVNIAENHYDMEYGYMFYLEGTYNTPDGSTVVKNIYCPVKIGCATTVASEAIKEYYDAATGDLVCDESIISVIEKAEGNTTIVNILAKYAKITISTSVQSRLEAIINKI